MINKLRYLTLVVLIFVQLLPLSSFAQDPGATKTDPALAWTVGLPFKIIGAGVSAPAGLLVGSVTGFIRGAVKGTNWVAETLGDEDGIWQRSVGVLTAPVFGTAYSVTGGLLSCGKGAWIGLQKPFEYLSFQSLLEGIPEAIEQTTDEASSVFSG